ncbi:MAG: gamma carbonic anhydrase family protein [Bacteroidetes bacterium GWF2_41_61]|nr:MAG: gamma carbonic anhydrase family protein [Bacteroidetes bacterium GWE2_40_15]OFY33938.1 MAG: gamma carbonic anhydrase family protein [Bacteroidetes bacterium GWF2_41_61]OFY88652.1 MAG: gamma carbonic anhydrase family protein [Bacteroidetes bacterium RIFOXYA12_FULL_40_10]HBG24689.1 gamma carbonic anhydrase family protein [Rikenellaceae bacterium]HBZ25316.1 gamma carbonic anhydrase family protein [Rikenellaceae bacterium]
MAIIRKLNGIEPKIGKNCFIAENAAIIGDVVIGDDCSVWYGSVLRGDVNPIRVGNRVNIQDGAVLHTLHKRSVVEIGDDVSVGHNAIVHGAKVGNSVLVGMGSILMDNAVIPDNTIIAAGAVVLSNATLEPGVYAGVPAKKVKEGSAQIAESALKNAQGYMMYKDWYLNSYEVVNDNSNEENPPKK